VQYNARKFEGKLDANMPLKHGVRSYFEYSKLAREGVLASAAIPPHKYKFCGPLTSPSARA